MVCGTYHDEIPGPVATARHTASTSPITSTDNSITRPESAMPPACRIAAALANAPQQGKMQLRHQGSVRTSIGIAVPAATATGVQRSTSTSGLSMVTISE